MKFRSEPVEEHHEVPLADEGQWEQLVAHWEHRERSPLIRSEEQNACYVVSILPTDASRHDGRLHELLGLVEAQGDAVVGHEVLQLEEIDPRTYLGIGRSKRIAEEATDVGANLLVVDAALSPSQARNLEDLTGLPVCDREAVILKVFHKHARTRAAKIQVEMAYLAYLRPRIRGLGLNMDQQAGGVMRGRGPGETASELLARQLDGRLSALRQSLKKLSRQGESQRKHREACERVVMTGYTNAGKTSLMNALTRAEGAVRNRPFETLDTTTRSLTRHGGEVLLSDTVGFIRDLPERLFASFASTLAELQEASLVAVVLDASDPEASLHLQTTEEILERLDAASIPRVIIFNKKDLCPPNIRELLSTLAGDVPCFFVSSLDEAEVKTLKESLVTHARGGERSRAEVFVPYAAAEVMSVVYGSCRVLEAVSEDRGMHFLLEASPRIIDQLQRATGGTQ